MQQPLNIARWIERSAVNGPGERFVVWLQGCPLHCPGCWNPDTWDFAPRRLLEVGELVTIVRRVPGLEGITLTGGEPFIQAKSLLPAIRQLRQYGLSVMIFTGYELEELTSSASRALLELTDIVVTGRFVETLRVDSAVWRGSSNQKVIFLTQRYSKAVLSTETLARVEAHIGGNGELALTGFPEKGLLDM